MTRGHVNALQRRSLGHRRRWCRDETSSRIQRLVAGHVEWDTSKEHTTTEREGWKRSYGTGGWRLERVWVCVKGAFFSTRVLTGPFQVRALGTVIDAQAQAGQDAPPRAVRPDCRVQATGIRDFQKSMQKILALPCRPAPRPPRPSASFGHCRGPGDRTAPADTTEGASASASAPVPAITVAAAACLVLGGLGAWAWA
jgi:hypothetical protein